LSKSAEESRLSKLYEIVVNEDQKFIMPSDTSKKELVEYVQTMIKDRTPRYLRKDGRPSHNLGSYKIPVNYFLVESNSVNYNASTGSVFLGGPDEEQQQEDEREDEEEEIVVLKGDKKQQEIDPALTTTNTTTTIPRHSREHDYGTMIVLYIFNQGRKTIDEIVKEIRGIDKNLITILVNKMIVDGYLKTWTDVDENLETGEKKEIQTLELVEKDEEKQKKGMLPENKG
jgi:hypothetical protein